MDYIPPERPALIAQARNEDRRHVYKIIDTGQIDEMDLFDDFHNLSTSEQYERVRQRGLKPGQYFPLCQADENQLTFYVQEHKPCSVPTFAAFRALTKLDPSNPEQLYLSEKQLGLIREILGDKMDITKYDVKVRPEILSSTGKNRRGLFATTMSKQKPTVIGSAYYLVSDAKNRVIEEVGFKGARKDSKYWLDEASAMFASVKFVKEKAKEP